MRQRIASVKKSGRKTVSVAQPELLPAVEELIKNETAGPPVGENIHWTNRSPTDMARELQGQGFDIGPDALRRILVEDLGLSRRLAFKDEANGDYAYRDEQFRHIANRRSEYQRIPTAWSVMLSGDGGGGWGTGIIGMLRDFCCCATVGAVMETDNIDSRRNCVI
jgi:hypothetical protein